MKYIKTYEKISKNWKVGDIIVNIEDLSSSPLMKAGKKFKVAKVHSFDKYIQIRNINSDNVYDGYYSPNLFVTPLEWEAKKFNL